MSKQVWLTVIAATLALGGVLVVMLEQFYRHTSNVTAANELMKTSGKKGGRSSASGDALDWLAH